jgi:hypothetical protein
LDPAVGHLLTTLPTPAASQLPLSGLKRYKREATEAPEATALGEKAVAADLYELRQWY